MLRAAVTVGGFAALSRVLGFARDVLIAAALGAGAVADAFFVSFKLVNLLRRLSAEGAVGAAFVPLFLRARVEDGEPVALRFLCEALSALFWALLALVAAAELLMPWLIRGLAPGFEPGGERHALAVELSRITFPFILTVALAAVLGGALNAIGRFAVVAAAPLLLNLALIGAALAALAGGLAPAHALAWGVSLAGAAQLLWIGVAAARAGLRTRLVRPRASPRLRRLGALFLPGLAGAGAGQVGLLVNSWFASHLPPGAVAHLFYADRLVQLPVGLIGVALGTALLPTLAGAARLGQPGAASAALSRALELALLLTLPAAAGLVLLAQPIIEVLFERGAFTAAATEATAATVAAMALGLPAYALAKVLAPAFFAHEDTATPVRVAALALLAQIAAILALVGPFAEAGIGLATALAGWLHVALLAVAGRRRLAIDRAARRRAPKILIATAVMALALLMMPPALDAPGLAFAIVVGAAVFFAAALALRTWRPADLRALLARGAA